MHLDSSKYSDLRFDLTWIIILLFIIPGCIQQEQHFKAVEIDFLNVRTLDEDDWIEIDGVRFNHVRAFEDVEAKKLTLPASRITKGEKRRGGDFTEPYPSLNIGYLLGSYINNINKDEQLPVEHDHTYKILNPDLMMALGKLQFIRSDTSEIQISTSVDYPAKIRSIPLD